jgi:hypothetical protein
MVIASDYWLKLNRCDLTFEVGVKEKDLASQSWNKSSAEESYLIFAANK